MLAAWRLILASPAHCRRRVGHTGWEGALMGREAADFDRFANAMPQLVGHQQMTDRGHIGAAHLQCLVDGGCELRIAELAANADHLDHGSCAMLSSLPLDQLIPASGVPLRPP